MTTEVIIKILDDLLLVLCTLLLCILFFYIPLHALIGLLLKRFGNIYDPDWIANTLYISLNSNYIKTGNRLRRSKKMKNKWHIYVNDVKVKEYPYWLQVLTYCLLKGYVFSGTGTDPWNDGYSYITWHPSVKIIRIL